MRKNCLAFCTTIFLVSVVGYAQDFPISDSLKNNLANAKSARDKVFWLGELSSFYRNVNQELCDEYAKEQLLVAELSRQRDLMITALLMQANSLYDNSSMRENMKTARKLSQQALAIAKESQMPQYEAWAYLYLARGERNDGENNKALNYNNLALSIATNSGSDSLLVAAYNSLGNTYESRKEKLLAFRNFLLAANTAEQSGNFALLKECYQNLSRFYQGIENFEKAKDYQFRIITLTKEFKKPYDRLETYNQLGRLYAFSRNYPMAERFYDYAIALCDTLGFKDYKINSYGGIIDMFFLSNEAQKAIDYLKANKELQNFIRKAGGEFYINHAFAAAYSETGMYDSARYYFEIAEPEFKKKASLYNQYYFFSSVANFHEKTGNYRKALDYWLMCESIGEARGDVQLLRNTAHNLDTVYQQLGDFKNAYRYKSRYHKYKDSLQTLEAEKDLLALEVENENQRKLREEKAAEDAKRERHNVQYMGITAGIAAVFIILVMLGAFSVSKTTIRIMGFFAFIFLFEFIILIADNKIHHATHGEPWQILAIKILLISILLPLHHWMEEKVIHFLTEKKLIEMSGKGLLGKLSGKTEHIHEM